MRLWHYRLIPYLPNKMLVSQWRECIAIKRQWGKGTLKHPLVSYVKNYSKEYYIEYVWMIQKEMADRNIRFKSKYYNEIYNFCDEDIDYDSRELKSYTYPEHNNRYLKQCYFNLQEKFDRGIITKNEWTRIKVGVC